MAQRRPETRGKAWREPGEAGHRRIVEALVEILDPGDTHVLASDGGEGPERECVSQRAHREGERRDRVLLDIQHARACGGNKVAGRFGCVDEDDRRKVGEAHDFPQMDALVRNLAGPQGLGGVDGGVEVEVEPIRLAFDVRHAADPRGAHQSVDSGGEARVARQRLFKLVDRPRRGLDLPHGRPVGPLDPCRPVPFGIAGDDDSGLLRFDGTRPPHPFLRLSGSASVRSARLAKSWERLFDGVFSPGIFFSGVIVNLCGCELQALQMNS